MKLKKDMKKIISAALVSGIFVSNCWFSSDVTDLFAEEKDDGVITLPFISLTDIDDPDDTEDTDKEKEDLNGDDFVPDNDETSMVKDDGSIILPFVPYEDDTGSEELTGDINKDGVVSAMDMMILKKIILKASDADFNGDINKDGKTDVMDMLKLLNILLG